MATLICDRVAIVTASQDSVFDALATRQDGIVRNAETTSLVTHSRARVNLVGVTRWALDLPSVILRLASASVRDTTQDDGAINVFLDVVMLWKVVQSVDVTPRAL